MKVTDWLLVIVGALQFVVLGVQAIIFGRQTRILGRQADIIDGHGTLMAGQLKATQDAAAAAQDSVKVANDTLLLTQRAYVFVEEPHSSIIVRTPDSPVQGMRFWVVWRNSGGTPTKKMLNVIGAVLASKEEDFSFGRSSPNGVTLVIGPHGAINSGSVEIDAASANAVWQNTMHLFIWGYASYRDVFDLTPNHMVEYCFKVRIEGVIAPGKCTVHFDVYGDHNQHYDE